MPLDTNKVSSISTLIPITLVILCGASETEANPGQLVQTIVAKFIPKFVDYLIPILIGGAVISTARLVEIELQEKTQLIHINYH